MKPLFTLPYYAVIFTSIQSEVAEGYEAMSRRMEELASRQPGFLGMDHARSDIGVTISYWKSESDILQWKEDSEHQEAQALGKNNWYQSYNVRICKVEREYSFSQND